MKRFSESEKNFDLSEKIFRKWKNFENFFTISEKKKHCPVPFFAKSSEPPNLMHLSPMGGAEGKRGGGKGGEEEEAGEEGGRGEEKRKQKEGRWLPRDIFGILSIIFVKY